MGTENESGPSPPNETLCFLHHNNKTYTSLVLFCLNTCHSKEERKAKEYSILYKFNDFRKFPDLSINGHFVRQNKKKKKRKEKLTNLR